jgi:hypothetical protein
MRCGDIPPHCTHGRVSPFFRSNHGTDEKGQLLVYMYSYQSDVDHLFRSQPQRKE